MSHNSSPDQHTFLTAPNRTLVRLSIPVTLATVAEPITGMVDTAFASQLGTVPLAALGIGTAALSTVFWVFSFLGISTQTEVSQALGNGNTKRAAEMTSLALILGVFFSLVMMAIFIPAAGIFSGLLGAEGDVLTEAQTYLRFRLLGTPAMLLIFIGFGALRGLQDMRTPMLIAIGINAINIILDGPLMFGIGAWDGMGVAGAGLASAIGQWTGALWLTRIVVRRIGFRWHIDWNDVWALLRVGGDLVVRTGLLTGYLLLATRTANRISPEAGAAHQAIWTVWIFLALMMEGFSITAQSLVGYFMGAGRIKVARRVAGASTRWVLGVGFVMIAVMLLSTDIVIALLVPDDALDLFRPAWRIAALLQPLAAMAFVTDGIHWGTGDFTYLRNAMITATLCGWAALLLIDTDAAGVYPLVWVATILWLGVRATLGTLRVWPGIGKSPLKVDNRQSVPAVGAMGD